MAGQLEKGRKIGPYEIKESLGKGGMASVYRAYQPSLERDVAIKVMAEQFASDANFAERFRREAKSIARLRHPNILTVYDIGEDSNLLYIAMEVIEGETLREEMRGKPLPIEKTLKHISQVADALDYANKAGIIHRDIKPSNVLIDKQSGRAVLSDFGIAKLAEATTSQLTATGLGVGTPDYMSPEQAQGEPIDARSDQYSLAVMTYEMLTGHTPYAGDTPIAVVMGHISKPLPSPRLYNPEIPVSIEQVLQKALSKRREDRFESAAAFNSALQKAWQERNKPVNSAEEATQVLNTHPNAPRPPQGQFGPPPGQYTPPPQGQFGPPQGQFGGTPPPNQYAAPGQFGGPPASGQFGVPQQGPYPNNPSGQGVYVPQNFQPQPQQMPTQQIYTPGPTSYVQQSGPMQTGAGVAPRKKTNPIAIVGAIALILLTGVAAAFVFNGEPKKTTPTPTAAPVAVTNTKTASATTAAPTATAAPAQATATQVPLPTQAPPPTPPGPDGPGKFANYTDPKGLWSIDAPEGWEPKEEADGGVSFNAPVPGLGLYVAGENAEAAGNLTLDALNELFVRQILKDGNGKVDRTSQRKVDGVNAIVSDGSYKQGGTVDIKIITLVKNNNFYAIILTVPSGPGNLPPKEREMLLDRMLASFRAL